MGESNQIKNIKHPCHKERDLALKTFYRLNSFLKVQDMDHFAVSLKDANLKNRIHSMRILWLLAMSKSYPVTGGTQRRIFDFLASMINDQDAFCRLTSCILISALSDLPYELSISTLSKKKNEIDGSNITENYAIKDPGDVEVTDVNMHEISAASYGSFIHASEDENVRVRSAVIDSMFQLGLEEKSYAEIAVKFLIDMFNDEESLVRRTAIQYVAILNKTWRFLIEDEDVDLYILAMKDNNPFVKSFAHKMLSYLNFKSKIGFERIIAILVAELNERDSAKDGVMEALSFLSKNHANHVMEILPLLFGLKDGFLSKECALEDLSHHAHLIMVFNAASTLPELISHLPFYIAKRYDFMRASYPLFIPNILAIEPSLDLNMDDFSRKGFLEGVLRNSSTFLQKPIHILKAYICTLESTFLPIKLCKSLLEYHLAYRNFKMANISADIESVSFVLANSIKNELALLVQLLGLPESFNQLKDLLANNLELLKSSSTDLPYDSGISKKAISNTLTKFDVDYIRYSNNIAEKSMLAFSATEANIYLASGGTN